MLIALFTMLFLGGDATPLLAYMDAYQERTKTVIIDERRRDQAKSILKAMQYVNRGEWQAIFAPPVTLE